MELVRNCRVYSALLNTVSFVTDPPGAFSKKELPNLISSTHEVAMTDVRASPEATLKIHLLYFFI